MTVETGTVTEPTAQQLWDAELAASGTPQPAAQVDPVEVVKVDPVTPAATPATPAVVDDPFAGLHPAVRTRLEAMDGLSNRLRNAEGHIGGLSSANKRLESELAAAQAAVKVVQSAPTAQQVAKANVTSEKWDQLKTEFPEWAEAVEERLGVQGTQPDLEALRNQIREELTPQLTSSISAALKADIEAKTETRLVNVAHRGWTNTVKTPEFSAWMQAQPADVQALGASPVAEDAITLLDQYAAHRQQAVTTPPVDPAVILAARAKRLQEAASVARGNANLAPTKSTDDMSPEEYWNYLAAQDLKEQQRR